MEIKNGVIGVSGITDISGDVTLIKGYTDTEVAAIKVETDKIPATMISTIASGSKTIASAATKFLSLDSGTNGAEILSIIIKGVVGAAWTLDVYVPAVDTVADNASGDRRDRISYLVTDTEGGLLQPFSIPFNAFLDFTNDAVASADITQVQIVYRSAGVLTLAWEA